MLYKSQFDLFAHDDFIFSLSTHKNYEWFYVSNFLKQLENPLGPNESSYILINISSIYKYIA